MLPITVGEPYYSRRRLAEQDFEAKAGLRVTMRMTGKSPSNYTVHRVQASIDSESDCLTLHAISHCRC